MLFLKRKHCLPRDTVCPFAMDRQEELPARSVVSCGPRQSVQLQHGNPSIVMSSSPVPFLASLGIHGRATSWTLETHPVKIKIVDDLGAFIVNMCIDQMDKGLFFFEKPIPVSCVDDDVQTTCSFHFSELAHMRRLVPFGKSIERLRVGVSRRLGRRAAGSTWARFCNPDSRQRADGCIG